MRGVPSAYAVEEGRDPKTIVLDASTDNLQGYIRWPWGVTRRQIEIGLQQPFLEWEETKEGDTTFYEGWMNHYARLDREQKDLEGARDNARLQLTFDAEQLTIRGSLDAHIVTSFKWPCQYIDGEFATFGCPGDYGDSVKEALCEGWIEGDIDIPLVENYKNSWRFAADVSMNVKFYVKSVVGYSHTPSADRVEERTETLTLPCNVNGVLSYFSEESILLSVWIQYTAGAYDLEGPSLNVMGDWGGYHCAVSHVTEWKEETALALTGPENVGFATEEAEFDLSWEGESVDLDTVEWTFSYRDMEGTWVDLESFQRDSVEGIAVPREGAEGINEWHEAFLEYGASSEGFRVLEMKAKARAYDNGELVALSNTFSFSYRVGEDLQLTVTGPQAVNVQTDRVLFNLFSEGPGVDLVRWVDWVFEYQDEFGDWVELSRIPVEGDISGINFSRGGEGRSWEYWLELAASVGVTSGSSKILTIRAQAIALESDERTLASSDSHQFTVEYYKRFQLEIAPKLDVYATMPNTTALTVDFGSLHLEEGIKLQVEGDLPPYLNVSFKDGELATNIFGRNTTEVSFRIVGGESITIPELPKEHIVTLKATSGEAENTTQIKLRLLEAEWLFMYYVAGDTDPNLQQYEQKNLLDIVKATEQKTPKVGIAALVDLRDPWAGPLPGGVKDLQGGQARFFKIQGGELEDLGGTGAAIDMGDPDILSQFIVWARSEIPAKKQILVISDHGTGMVGLVKDHHQGGILRINEIADKLKNGLGNEKLDVIAFDACVMAQMEVLYHLRDYARYFVASELVLHGEGLTYHEFMPRLLAKPEMGGLEFSKLIVDTYTRKGESDYTLAAFDSSKLGALAQSIDSLGKALAEIYNQEENNVAPHYRLNIDAQMSISVRKYPYYDLGNLCENIIRDSYITDESLKQKARAVINALEQARVREKFVRFQVELVYPTRGYEVDRPWNPPVERKWVKAEEAGFTGLTIFVWPKGTERTFSEGYRFYRNYFDRLSLRTDTSWGDYLDAMNARVRSDGVALTLKHSGNELYLHVYDEDGRHVGFNQFSEDRTMWDSEIPGSFYLEYENGTELIILPSNVTDFNMIVDGGHMEEEAETYWLTCNLILEGELVHEEIIESTITEKTGHVTPIQLAGEEMVVGAMKVETITQGEPEPTPTPEPEPEPEQRPGGIPGFPSSSIIIGFTFGLCLIWIIHSRVKANPYS